MKKYVEIEAIGELMVRTISPILTDEQIHAEYEEELASRKEKESKCPICGAKSRADSNLDEFSHPICTGGCPLEGHGFSINKWHTLIELWEGKH